jgi:hypothetical protein
MNQYYKGEQVFYSHGEVVTLSSTYIPQLPKAGFEPSNGFSLALSAVLLIAVGIAIYPYVREAFAALRG